MSMSTVITSIDPGSPAQQAGIRVGEKLLTLNGHEIIDVLDYRFFCYDPVVRVELEEDGKVRHLRIRKEEGEDLGLNFDTYLMDEPRPCSNHCVFCFVDQMPPGMRDSLYFKDDDARLSFLMGNYITLTNLTEREAQRIIDLRISPINVSVQATEPQLRRTLLGNKNADKSLDYMRAFGKAGIEMNGQIVVCPGWNEGEHLRRTIEDLMEISFRSCSVVPVGLTKYRRGLAKVPPVDAAKAAEIIDTVDEYGEKCLKRFGTRMFFCADELYLKAGRELPDEAYYEDYNQLDNGVGMLRSTMNEFLDALADVEDGDVPGFTVATGVAAAPFITRLVDAAKKRFPGLDGEVVAIVNDFFGHSITVSGLVTGQDIIAQLSARERLGERIIIPANMLRHGEGVFLDDVTLDGLSEALSRPVQVSETDGYSLADTIFTKEEEA
jgi:putative radical SAM enzyme (TIGR03279 family)